MPEPQEDRDPVEVVQLTAETLGRDILQAMLDEIKLHVSWNGMPAAAQHQMIERLRKRTRTLIEEGLNVLFRGHYPAIPAELDSITIKNGISAKITIAKGQKDWHELADAQGTQILLIVADPEQYAARMDEIKAVADQGDLFSGEYKGTNEYRRDQPPPVVDKSWQDLIDDLNKDKETPQPGDITFGNAEPPPPPKTMAEQVLEALAAVHVIIDLETAAKYTEQECVCAFYWARKYLEDPDTAPARPHWLPIPDPPRAESPAEPAATDPPYMADVTDDDGTDIDLTDDNEVTDDEEQTDDADA